MHDVWFSVKKASIHYSVVGNLLHYCLCYSFGPGCAKKRFFLHVLDLTIVYAPAYSLSNTQVASVKHEEEDHLTISVLREGAAIFYYKVRGWL